MASTLAGSETSKATQSVVDTDASATGFTAEPSAQIPSAWAETSQTGSATSATASTTSSTAPEPNSSPGHSDGVVAGVAIACIVAGLALGFVAAFLYLRRRRARRAPPTALSQDASQSPEPKGNVLVTAIPSNSDVELDQFLLTATPDKEIGGELYSVSELIYQHVENHYHRSPVQADPAVMAQSLVSIGYSSQLSKLEAEAVAALCVDPKTRRLGLRHVLSNIMLQSLDCSSRNSHSMLPPTVAAFLHALPPRGRGDSSGKRPQLPSAQSLICTAADAVPPAAHSLALSRWRSLTALLLHPAPSERTPLPVSVVEASAQARSLANELNSLLHIFVTQDAVGRQQQISHLHGVILECTRLGYTVFSQPSDWGFIFSSSSSHNHHGPRIVVCPGLEKRSRNDGGRYSLPKEIVAADTMAL
ncbi:hypothetical protein FZEAL_4279 [Fusarium zealandicum]|uniref:Uncharacterized protein n=1 Tax=Fusarium zealandicum TaxID=1053134 RepID=A0A8H4ULY4_9HYPO|nr:hypothetical protein FZEAL_4279 [Fusarium zealandicum]